MASLVAGVVTVSDAGVASFTPSDPEQSLAGQLYLAELEASDEYTTANGGTVQADAERVPLLRWYALRSNKVAARWAAYLNANL